MRPLPLVVPPDLRFTCHGCGACCRSFTVALEPGEAERIARHDWTREAPRFREGPFAKPGTGPYGDPRMELVRRPDGACIFLDEKGLCLVEARLGRAAKPRTCRKFPFEFVAAPDGLRAVVSLECESRWRSASGGAPVAESKDELQALAAGGEPYRTAWRIRLASDGLLLAPEAYLALERELLAAVDAPGSLERMLGALAEVIARRRERGSPGGGASPGGTSLPGAERFPAVLAAFLAGALPVACEHVVSVGRGIEVLASTGTMWLAALRAAEASPEGAAFVRLCVRSWIEAAIPGREPTAEEGVGRMIAGAILIAGTARDLGARDPAARAECETARAPSAAILNRAARSVSVLLRGRARTPLREAVGGFAALARAAIGLGAP